MLFRLKSGETPNSEFSTEITPYATLLKDPQLPSLSPFSLHIKRMKRDYTILEISLSSPTTINSNANTRMVVRTSREEPEAAATPSNHTMTISIFSNNGNLMLAATITLLLVILFVLLLHIYAKWFLLRARHRRIRRRQASSLTGFLRGFHHFQTFSSFDAASSSCPSKGLDPSLISSIPIFFYKRNPDSPSDDDRIRQDLGLECVICLSDFEDDEIGRALAKCGHAFHAECIDMWLHSHTTCPICRAPAVAVESLSHEIGAMQQGEWETVIEVGEDNNNTNNMNRVEEEEVASVVMDVFIVSVSVSSRRPAEEECLTI